MTSSHFVISKFFLSMIHLRKLLLCSVNHTELLQNSAFFGKWSVSPSCTKISVRSQAEPRECVPNKRVKSVTTLDIRKTSGRSEPLENYVPLFHARRPDGYEKYEIWFSRILNGVQAVSLAHRCSPSRSLPRSTAPHAYRGRISRPAGRPL